MFDSWEERRARSLPAEAQGLKFCSGAELMAMVFPPSAEERLDAVLDACPSPRFREAVIELVRAGRFEVDVWTTTNRDLPVLGRGSQFKYAPAFKDCVERRLAKEPGTRLATVREVGRVVGFGIARARERCHDIETIDVDRFSRRSAGVSIPVSFSGQDFGVGVGHLLVVELLSALGPGQVSVDATNPGSRFICKSLGFRSLPGETNPCLLYWQPAHGAEARI